MSATTSATAEHDDHTLLATISADLLEIVLSQLDAANLANAEGVNRVFRASIVGAPTCWRAAASRSCRMVGLPALLQWPASTWKELCRTVSSGVGARPLLRPGGCTVVASSSDRDEERPENVLSRSACELTERKTRCSCWGGREPCYWSSAGTGDGAAAEESLTFSNFTPRLALVHSVRVRPYQAFWHPGHPVYAPRAASVRLESTEDGGPAFSVAAPRVQVDGALLVDERESLASMYADVATFSRPLLVPWSRTRVILKLHGAAQRFTGAFPGDDADFYVCLSAVGMQGWLLPQAEAALPPEEGRRAQRGGVGDCEVASLTLAE
jgi:hypothetical protein